MCEYIQNIGPLCTCYHLKGNLETEPTVSNPLPLVPTLSLSKDIKSSLHIAMIKYAALRRSAKPNPTCKSSLGSVGYQNSAMTTTLNQSLADASQHQAWASFFWQRLILVSNQRRNPSQPFPWDRNAANWFITRNQKHQIGFAFQFERMRFRAIQHSKLMSYPNSTKCKCFPSTNPNRNDDDKVHVQTPTALYQPTFV